MEQLYLFFDTETTGLIDFNVKLSEESLPIFPYLVELAWVLTNSEGRILDSESKLIIPKIGKHKWEIKEDMIHKINQGMAEGYGDFMDDVLTRFNKIVRREELANQKLTLVAHNIQFDLTVLEANFMRIGRDPIFPESRICTMLSSIEYCQIPNYGNRPGYKYPKLSELYERLFEKEFPDAHSALSDVMATRECFFALRDLGVITK